MQSSAVMQPLYQNYTIAEDQERTNLHYDRSARFFQTITGGEWHVYSCNLWDNAQTVTESQRAKLDLFAKLVDLQPGQSILDVGCGWGGPLTYLCKTYDVSGIGITLSPSQQRAAQERADRHGADVEIVLTHWRDFTTDRHFDLIYSDEVLVHISDLVGLFGKLHGLLTPDGSMLHKELHLTHSDYATAMTRGSSHMNDVFGCTGNYRSLAEELSFLMAAGLCCRGVHTIDGAQYRKTIDGWIANMTTNRDKLIELEGREFYDRILKYLKISRMFVVSPAISIDIVHSQAKP